MKKVLFLFLLFLTCSSLLSAQGYEISVHPKGYVGDSIQLGYFLMDKQYLLDTVAVQKDGSFIFEGDEKLAPGMYMLVFPPENEFLQLVLPEDDQIFSVEMDFFNMAQTTKFKGSEENEIFYKYLNFLSEKGEQAQALRQKQEAGDEKAREEMAGLDKQVKAYQDRIVEKQPGSMTALIVKATREPEIPEFTGEKAEVDRKRFYYYRDHYFDNLDLSDLRLLRSPVLFNKVDRYVQKLTVQHPDSINQSLDRVLQMMEPAEETFKYYLVHFLNEYAKSKFVGMDAVYVHLVKNYYATGKATWTEEEQLQKIIENAETLEPLLLGKIAPDIPLQILDVEGTLARKDHEKELFRVQTKGIKALHEVDAPYTVLVFWDPDCGHCKKSMPKLKDFYQAYRDKGVEVYAVCGRTVNENGMVKCAEYLKENELTGWLNMVDPYYKTRFKSTYDIKSTPQVYVLDQNKEIISKRIDVDQLEEVLLNFMKKDAEEQAESAPGN